MNYRKILSIALVPALAAPLLVAHPVAAQGNAAYRPTVYDEPIAGVRNNKWYDYRSDLAEAENELRKDLRRAKTDQDRREARAEYRRELADARHDYRKEMREKGYIAGRGEVIVHDD